MLLAVSMMLSTAMPSRAEGFVEDPEVKIPLSAFGCEPFGGFCVEVGGKKVCYPGATLCHTVRGNGKTITYQDASVDDNFGGGTAGGNFCNWRIDWEYRDTNGKVYFTDAGPMHYKCEGSAYPIGRVDKKRRVVGKYGSVCAVFHASGGRRAAQCHFITQ